MSSDFSAKDQNASGWVHLARFLDGFSRAFTISFAQLFQIDRNLDAGLRADCIDPSLQIGQIVDRYDVDDFLIEFGDARP